MGYVSWLFKALFCVQSSGGVGTDHNFFMEVPDCSIVELRMKLLNIDSQVSQDDGQLQSWTE